jgi:hypothetical protein
MQNPSDHPQNLNVGGWNSGASISTEPVPAAFGEVVRLSDHGFCVGCHCSLFFPN